MQCGTWRGFYSNEAIAEERVRNDLRSTIWTNVLAQKNGIVRQLTWRNHPSPPNIIAVAAMDYAEKSQDHTERLGWMKDYEEIFDISPQHEISQGSSVSFAKIKSDEYMAIAWIAQDKAYLAKASLLKTKHRAQWAKEKIEFDDEMSECADNEIPECVGE